MEELMDMTRIVDPNNTIKSHEVGEDLRATLIQKYRLDHKIRNISPIILQIVQRKCAGNPLLCMGYFLNMLHNDFLELGKNGNLIPTEKFKLCNRIDNWTNLPVPRHSLKLTIQSLSTFYFQIQKKPNQKPGELDTAIIANILLKVATILGREFQTDALKYISPLNRIG